MLVVLLLGTLILPGCQWIPGRGAKNAAPKKTIFGVHGNNDPTFGEKAETERDLE